MKLINIDFTQTKMPFGKATVLKLGDRTRFKNIIVKRPHSKHYNISITKQFNLCFVGEQRPSDGWVIKLTGKEILAQEKYTQSFLKLVDHRHSDISKRDVICICNIFPVVFYESRSDGKFTAYHIKSKNSYTVSIVDNPRDQATNLISLTNDGTEIWNLRSYELRVFLHTFVPKNTNEQIFKILYPIRFCTTFGLTRKFDNLLIEPNKDGSITYWTTNESDLPIKNGKIVGVPHAKYTAYDQVFPSGPAKTDKMTIDIAQKIVNYYLTEQTFDSVKRLNLWDD
ncbi:hypothetical protein [Shouchella clausii]|uniref:Uncharacterized protein n=1 Tax=Shouchella clausii TaxID=79880 RepID=A0A268NW74_SHOCL|nr:hypothetical protein [Shouchella clausii]PAE87641.1 hypothetical protein CHH72_17295 [Shouchella clausii]